MVDLLEITKDTKKRIVDMPDGRVEIVRRKNETQLITGFLQPVVPIPGVTPVGELEVLDALGDPDFLVVDMREPEWRIKATIPGSVSIPFSDVAQRLSELGCSRTSSGWDCADARKISWALLRIDQPLGACPIKPRVASRPAFQCSARRC